MARTTIVSISSLLSVEEDGTHLFHQQIPVDAHRGLFVLPAVFAQAPRQLTHSLQTVSTIQQVLDVLGHDLRHILELVV